MSIPRSVSSNYYSPVSHDYFVSPSPIPPAYRPASVRLSFTPAGASRPQVAPDAADPPATLVGAAVLRARSQAAAAAAAGAGAGRDARHNKSTPFNRINNDNNNSANGTPSFHCDDGAFISASRSLPAWGINVLMLLQQNQSLPAAALVRGTTAASARNLKSRGEEGVAGGGGALDAQEEKNRRILQQEMDEVEFVVFGNASRALSADATVIDLKEAIVLNCRRTGLRPAVSLNSFCLVYNSHVLPDMPTAHQPTLSALGLFPNSKVYAVECSAEQYVLREILATRLVGNAVNRRALLEKATSLADKMKRANQEFEELLEEQVFPQSPRNRNMILSRDVRLGYVSLVEDIVPPSAKSSRSGRC